MPMWPEIIPRYPLERLFVSGPPSWVLRDSFSISSGQEDLILGATSTQDFY
ncbi:antibiotic ABC transporter ATP-binding protein [Sesbania bispinosa]|nr:antibiotic ABC transporter ATP-binding protein [Sesbania bispinosa]